MSRYDQMFERLETKNEGAFIPFVVVGDPNPETSLKIIEGLIEAGADALELGFPFSDPIADGPVIQRAGARALEAGITQKDCFQIVASIRRRHPDIPIGLLVYANLVVAGRMETFFETAHLAGVDSVLVADLPERESGPFREAANRAGIELVLVLPVHADEKTVQRVASAAQGYLYLLSRKGVTGKDGGVQFPSPEMIKMLKKIKAPPPVLGFGIGEPDQAAAALQAGCRGVISGSAIVGRIEAALTDGAPLDGVLAFARTMKQATLRGHEIACRSEEFAT